MTQMAWGKGGQRVCVIMTHSYENRYVTYPLEEKLPVINKEVASQSFIEQLLVIKTTGKKYQSISRYLKQINSGLKLHIFKTKTKPKPALYKPYSKTRKSFRMQLILKHLT